MQTKCITWTLLHETVKTLTENSSWKAKNVADKFQKYLTRNKIENELKRLCSVKITWRGEEQERVQHNAIVIKDTANYTFDYSLLSSVKWRKGMKDVNAVSSDNIII
jgi:hypothetical protein